jgi:hypothetical protein
MNGRLDLHDYLIKPIQRICKYPLLIKELLKYTPSGCAEHSELKSALEKMEKVLVTINVSKGYAESEKLTWQFFRTCENYTGPGIRVLGNIIKQSNVMVLDVTNEASEGELNNEGASTASKKISSRKISLFKEWFFITKPKRHGQILKYFWKNEELVWCDDESDKAFRFYLRHVPSGNTMEINMATGKEKEDLLPLLTKHMTMKTFAVNKSSDEKIQGKTWNKYFTTKLERSNSAIGEIIRKKSK